MFLYDNIIKTDFLLKYLHDLGQILNVNLYIKENFNELNNLFSNYITEHLILQVYKKRGENKKIKTRNLNTDINYKINNINEKKKSGKTPNYFLIIILWKKILVIRYYKNFCLNKKQLL